ncbi:glyoxalase [Serratia ficaria]|uniref:glyoxalase n=1 Tax=Serratia ficaria TaxID=61651 RepID=UPI00217AE9C2|nr:glyoxalase [Serratia ficaria]CAI1736696.1 Uncharacterised protein [Serratia ficaria]
MEQQFAGLGVLFIAGFGPVTQNTERSTAFYLNALGLPLKPMPGNDAYLLGEQGAFALWPLAQAAQSCFGSDGWPADLPVPQAWLEFDIRTVPISVSHTANKKNNKLARKWKSIKFIKSNFHTKNLTPKHK